MKWHFDDFIYGAIDGAVTTFAVVAGVAGASLSIHVILILGFANLFADGLSMAIANYQATKAKSDYIAINEKSSSQAAESTIAMYYKNPLDSSLSTFLGFNSIGIIPLIPFMILYVLGMNLESTAIYYSTAATCVAFFVVGVIKGKIIQKPIIKTGLATLSVGSIAAIVAYLVAYMLRSIIT